MPIIFSNKKYSAPTRSFHYILAIFLRIAYRLINLAFNTTLNDKLNPKHFIYKTLSIIKPLFSLSIIASFSKILLSLIVPNVDFRNLEASSLQLGSRQ